MFIDYIINSGDNGHDMTYPKTGNSRLHITHSAGFFSCNTIALQDIVIWSREHKRLPKVVNRHSQYSLYKHYPNQTLIDLYFAEQPNDIDCSTYFELTYENRELQYIDYRHLLFDNVMPFVNKYFTPSEHVMRIVEGYERDYNIDYENTCAIFYRGNDKNREMSVAEYGAFIDKAKEVSCTSYLVQPDETEFLEAFKSAHPNSFNFAETPHISKKDSAVFLEMPTEKRAEFAAYFMAAVIVMSKCKHMIIHTGNCALWSVLYRGNIDNVHQIRDNNWL